VNVTIYQP